MEKNDHDTAIRSSSESSTINSSDSSLDSASYSTRSNMEGESHVLSLRGIMEILGKENVRNRSSSIPHSFGLMPISEAKKSVASTKKVNSHKLLNLSWRKYDKTNNEDDTSLSTVPPARASTSLETDSQFASNSSYKRRNYFKRRDVDMPVLSSQSSNSQVVKDYGPSIYSFGPGNASPFSHLYTQINRPLSNADSNSVHKLFWSQKDSETEVWAILRKNILPLMNGEGLKLAVEDFNTIITAYYVHMIELKKQKIAKQNVIKVITAGLAANAKNFFKHSHDDRTLQWLFEMWSFFQCSVLPYLEAIFLPISLLDALVTEDLNEKGKIQDLDFRKKGQKKVFDVRSIGYECFRDIVIIPNYNNIENGLLLVRTSDKQTTILMKDSIAKILSAIRLLASITPPNQIRKKLIHLASIV